MRVLLNIILLVKLIILTQVNGQDKIDQSLLIDDTKHLIRLLEDSHPDPYSPFGGKVLFKLEAGKLVESLPAEGLSDQEFRKIISRFLAKLHDGHTNLKSPDQKQGKTLSISLPIKLSIASNGLFVQDVTSEAEDLMGGKIISINDVSIKELLENIQEIQPCENIFGAFFHLKNAINDRELLKTFFPGFSNELRIKAQLPDNSIITKAIRVYSNSGIENSDWTNQSSSIKNVNGVYNYEYIGKDKKTMYFYIKEMFSREVIEAIERWNHPYLEQGWGKEILDRFYPALKKPYDEAVELGKIPYLTRVFKEMLFEMRENGSEHLVIDLRENRGGYSFIAIPLMYLLYGDEYFGTPSKAYDVLLLSKLYLAKNKITLEQYNQNRKTEYELGDYIVSTDKDDRSGTSSALENRNSHLEFLSSNEFGCLKFLEDLNGKPAYKPRNITVLTSPGTNSAAFTFLFYLWEMKDNVSFVGVPPRQSGNAPIEHTPFVLPLTGIEGSISNHYQVSFPGDLEKGKTFWPDYTMKWKDFKKYNFSKDAEILFTLDLIKKESIK